MAIQYDARSSWGAAPPKKQLNPWPGSGPTHCVYHYVGGPNFAAVPANHSVCLNFVKSIQFYEMNSGYSDVAYNVFACGHGRVIEGRGLHVQSGAQFGDNDDGFAICFLMNVPNLMTDGFKRSGIDARQLALQFYPNCKAYDGHRNSPSPQVAQTACPGVAVMSWITAKGPEAVAPAPSTKASGAVEIILTTTGKGYYIVASDGGVFTFGDAKFFGSMGGKPMNAPVVDMATRPQNDGYILVGADGGTFRFGAVKDHGNIITLGVKLQAPIVSIELDADGDGYWMLGADGGVFAFGVPNYGNAVGKVA